MSETKDNQAAGGRCAQPAGSRLQDRWTQAERELAYQISNDIAEGIDNSRHTRKQLRIAVAVWADLYHDLYEERILTATEESLAELKRLVRKLEV